MTSALYLEDPRLLEFEARVVATRPTDQGMEIVLDRSAFYPEGGGQPADHGDIRGIPVVHVRSDGRTIYHRVSGEIPDSFEGAVVPCRIDASRRRDYQQQHTGQHLLSGAFMQVGPYPTVSVHQGTDYTTIEIETLSIPDADLDQVERRANEAIEADLPVVAQWATEETIGAFPLRRPPKVSGSIRVVRIGDFDCVACGGVHVSRTAEVRLVRLLDVESIRGNTRTIWKIGDRAFAHYREASAVVRELGSALSARPHELAERVGIQEERIRTAELEIRRLNERLYELVAARLLDEARPEQGSGHGRTVITADFAEESKDLLRGVTERLVREPGVAVCLVNRTDERLQWSIGAGPGVPLEFDSIRGELFPVIAARGGGRPPVWQGTGARVEAAPEFLERFRKLAEEVPREDG